MVDDVEWLNANEKIDELCWAFISFKLNRWNGKTHDNDDEDEDEFGSKETRFDEFRRIKSWNGFGSCSKIFSSRKKSLDGFYFLMNICCTLKKNSLLDVFERRAVPLSDVGHVEIISLLLFFVGNEKSLRGQQLTSIAIDRWLFRRKIFQ